MTLKNMLELTAKELAKLSTKALSNINNRLRAVTRSRLKSLRNYEKAYGYKSPALQAWEEGEGFRIGKNLNEKRNEYAKLRQFLNYKTSTYSGTQEYREQISQKVGEENASSPDFWTKFEEYKKYMQQNYGWVNSNLVLQSFTTAVNSNPINKEELFKRAENILTNDIYGLQEDIRDDFWDYDDIFEDF